MCHFIPHFITKRNYILNRVKDTVDSASSFMIKIREAHQNLGKAMVNKWLENLTVVSIASDPFPLRVLLTDSLYYPASGFDGDPVRHLGGSIQSFVYADYGYSQGDLMEALRVGFSGYELLATRSVSVNELIPEHWQDIRFELKGDDPLRYREQIKEPFCMWTVFERRCSYSDNHGPSRFSLLYLCAEGVAAFQALYAANAITPRAIAVIQPGHAFGNNWTDFTDPDKALARAVFSNMCGKPSLLLYGGYGKRERYKESCWPSYSTLITFMDKSRLGNIGLWAINE